MSREFQQWSVKYRPNKLEDYIGSPDAVEKTKTVLRKKDTHAFLIHGPSGAGKTTLARIIANAFTSHSTDILEKNVSIEKTIDVVRGWVESSKFNPRGDYKVYILDEVHALQGQAASAILKTIEEPEHDRVIWILCTNKPHLLSGELVNRCYKIQVQVPELVDLAKLLFRVAKAEKVFPKYDIDRVKKICMEVAKAADRVPREALQLLKEISDSSDKFTNFKDLIINGIRKRTDDSIDKTAIQMIMAMYSTEKDVDFRAAYLVNQSADKDLWGLLTRLLAIHHNLMMHVGGVKTPASYYAHKELEKMKAIPTLQQAALAGAKLSALRNELKNVDSAIEQFIIPGLLNILYQVDQQE